MTLTTKLGSRSALRLSVLVVPVLFALATQVAAAGPYREGQTIEITGTVTDSAGLPVPDVDVVLKVQRKSFSAKKMSRKTRDVQRVSTRTGPRGGFTLTWRWFDYYNRFELMVGLPIRGQGEEDFQIFEKMDLKKIIKLGSPVVANIVVTDTSGIESLQDFMSQVDSDDKRKVYDDMGKPGRVQNIVYPTYTETTWWYFRSGRAYRFRGGHLEQVVHFEAIDPISG